MARRVKPQGEVRAREVLDTQWFQDPHFGDAIDPVIIARRLGVNVFQAEMPNSVSGYIVKRGPETAPDIFVNSEHAPVRQNFTVAHELGHYFHRKDQGPEFNNQYVLKRDQLASCGTNDEEIYANQFAAELLMPDDTVEEMLKFGLQPLEIAHRLKVSYESLDYRMRNLGLG